MVILETEKKNIQLAMMENKFKCYVWTKVDGEDRRRLLG